ncbi:MAG: uracil phosphoribosyltransferase [Alphaproteobacteria bacterium]|nr:uracil phosphoribosyltransferase [Alphaproteobacteria bacterium]
MTFPQDTPAVTKNDLERAAEFPNFHLITHPLVQDKLSRMRDKTTSTGTFRQLMKQVGVLMGYEVTRDLPVEFRAIQTPLTQMTAPYIQKPMVAIVPILRAGTGLADGLLELMPAARMGNIGLYRDSQTHKPVEYMVKLPSVKNRLFLLVDPMLATGNSAAYAVDVLLKHGVKKENIRFVALLAAPEGVRVFNEKHADIPIYCAALDAHLNEKNYIMPGLGDAGDRLYGTP